MKTCLSAVSRVHGFNKVVTIQYKNTKGTNGIDFEPTKGNDHTHLGLFARPVNCCVRQNLQIVKRSSISRLNMEGILPVVELFH